jgi:hypothetical protein
LKKTIIAVRPKADQDQIQFFAPASRLAIAAGNHADFKQSALQRAVEQRCLAARLEADQLGQTQVGGEEEAVPAGPVLFSAVPSCG